MESIAFGVFVLAVLYVIFWAIKNDDIDEIPGPGESGVDKEPADHVPSPDAGSK